MSEWSGFSDADIRRMRQMSENESARGGPKIVKPVTGGRPKSASNIGQKPQRKQNPKTVTRTSPKGDVPPGALLSKQKKMEEKKKVESPTSTPNEQIPLHGKTSPPPSPEMEQAPSVPDTKIPEPREPEIVEDVNAIQEKEKLKLEDIQKRQKEMEEKNKRKKTMLTKAIAERKKKAFAESNKLLKIQAELSKLDDMLNYDVSILRDKIDVACHDYNAAQKRFERAEAEYIDSKMKLHKATELKEDLTEHLYGLIQLNEERKAKKLEELMLKLELEEDADLADDSNSVEATVQSPTSQPLKPHSPMEDNSSLAASVDKMPPAEEAPTEDPQKVENDDVKE